MLDRGAGDILFAEGPEGIFGGTAELLVCSDLTVVNLEGPVSSQGTKTPKSFNFRFEPRLASALKNAGIDAVLQANNHSFDYGETAFLDSLIHLRNAGLGILGAGLNDDEAAQPFVLQKGPYHAKVYGIASFPREWNGWDGLSAAAEPDKPGMLHAGKGGADKLKRHFHEAPGAAPPAEIQPAADPAETVLDIVLFHGGDEWSRRPNAPTRRLYTELIREGADLIIGSHPHVVQGFEWIEDKAVFWSLGNYVFGGMENTEGGEEGLFIYLGYWGSRLVYLEPFALTLTHTRTSIAPEERRSVFYERSRNLQEGSQ
jgi:poly-gamma-glutamate synthesis protein (capsule biosynthesis protein)